MCFPNAVAAEGGLRSRGGRWGWPARAILALTAGLACLGVVPRAHPAGADGDRPAVVAAARPLDEMAPRMDRLLQRIGAEHVRLVFRLVFQQATRGIDPGRPAGAFVPPGDGHFRVVWLMPVERMDQISDSLTELLGRPERVGNLDQYPGEAGWQVRRVAGWAMAARGGTPPESVPAGALRLIDRLASRYDVAVEARPQAVREPLATAVRRRTNSGIDQLEKTLFPRDPASRLALGTAADVVAATLAELLAGSASATLGANLDDQEGAIRLELAMPAAEGSWAADWFQQVRRAPSPLPALPLAEPAIRVQLALPLTGSLQDRWLDVLGQARADLEAETGPPPAAAEPVRAVVDAALELAQSVVRRGRADFRMAVSLQPAASLVLMTGLADRPAPTREALEGIAAAIEKNPEVSRFRRTAEALEGGQLIVLQYDWEGSQRAARFFGAAQTLALGHKAHRFVIGYGRAADRQVRRLLGELASADAGSASPLEVRIATAALIPARPQDRTASGPAPDQPTPDDQVLLQIVPADQGAVTRVVIQRLPLRSLIDMTLLHLAGLLVDQGV